MLRGLVFLVIALSVVLTTQAQSLEFETLRTETAPGFFALKIFPGPSLKPIPVENVYIKNFKSQKEASSYQSLISVLNELGTKIVTPTEADDFQFSQYYRLIWLGGDSPTADLHFVQTSENLLQDFEAFSVFSLGPVYLTNVDLQFGGNISEVYPQTINFLGPEAIVYGKFERPIKTRLSIAASSEHGEIEANAPVYLDEYEAQPENYYLGEAWEVAHKKAQGITTEKKHNDFWLNLFPWLLLSGGVLLIVLASLHLFRSPDFSTQIKQKNRWPNLSKAPKVSKEWWDQPIEETPIYKDWEDNLPFEVVDRSE